LSISCFAVKYDYKKVCTSCRTHYVDKNCVDRVCLLCCNVVCTECSGMICINNSYCSNVWCSDCTVGYRKYKILNKKCTKHNTHDISSLNTLNFIEKFYVNSGCDKNGFCEMCHNDM
jgi:hypothetical protein